jgi:hypothetical protein
MRNRRDTPIDRTREKRFMDELRQRPELLERFETILELTRSDDGALRSADEVEALLVEEVRRLGNRAMHEWAEGAEVRVAQDFKEVHPQVRLRKKKP